MARSRKKSKASKKSHTPAVRHLRYRLSTAAPGVEVSYFLDVMRDLSLVNRRLYRQGKHLFIKKISVTSRDTTNGLVSVAAAPTSWMVYAAWKKAFKLWNQMREGHGGAPGSGLPTSVTPATWADFKVYLSTDHRAATMPLPVDNGNNAVVTTNADWDYSRFISPDGTTGADEFTAHLLGAHDGAVGAYNSVGIVQGYEESRRTVEQDNTGSEINTDSWMINLFDDGTTLDEIADDLKEDGDFPPYQFDQYAGAAINMPKPIVQQLKAIVSSPETPTVTLGAVQAPCGLLEIELQSDTENDLFDVIIEVAEGDYKGVKALPM